jgi:glutamate--cysteine ligase
METVSAEQRRMLRSPFSHGSATELIGLEIEAGVVDPRTGVSLPYRGERSVNRLLRAIADRWGAAPKDEAGELIGLTRDDGTEIALESGCALEYVSVPSASLAAAVDKANQDLSALARIADAAGAALLSGSMLPFDTRDDVSWAPKPRIPLMLAHFDREVGPKSEGWAAMAQILSIQTTLDYLDPEDMVRKYRMANAVSPLVAALFVNSPLYGGQLTQALSRRMQIWTNVDRRRVGLFPHSIAADFRVDDLVEWALDLPLIFRTVEGSPRPAPPRRSFRSLLAEGYGDGSAPGGADWMSLLSTTWPYVRLRRTLELRIADTPFGPDWAAGPALWVGLAYDRDACAAAWELVRGYTLAEHLQAVDDVAMRGPAATIGGDPVLDVCRELVAIARDSLGRRVERGLEPASVLGYLDPVAAVVESGVSHAERLADRWLGELGQEPARYVAAYRYR